jgi:2-polyprenyl-6-methoxyphenol hydroxylase-like FAD-dependent oxidoreductase
MTPLQIAIVGAGTAGAAAALLLRRQGHRVDVYEAVEDPRPIGAGITLQPSGMAVLAELGLLNPIVARGAPLEALQGHTRAGRPVVQLRYADLHASAFGLGIHRGVLFETLFDALPAAGVHVHTGRTMVTIHPRNADGQRVLEDEQGGRTQPFDLVIVADGVRSELRDDTPLTRSTTEYPYGALWFIGEDPNGHFGPEIRQVFQGTRRMVGFLPTGLGPTGTTPLVSMFWSFAVADEPVWRAAGLEAFKDDVRRLAPFAEPLLTQISDINQILLARYRDVVMYPWHSDGIVYVGDAAHATSPQLGQGANLALVDASVLARCIDEALSVDAALHLYSRRRHASLRYYQFATRWLTPWFQSHWTPLSWARDAFMGPACRVPYVRRRMLQTMAGLETGFFSAPEPMPLQLLASNAHER